MNDHDALLTAILADLVEDTPRLVYADCIEEEQPERAEFIRVQVELARMGPITADGFTWNESSPLCDRVACNVCPLRRRQQELLATNVKAWSCWPTDWVMNLSPEAGFHGYRIDGADVVYDRGGTSDRPLHRIASFTRGFVSALTCTWADWRDHADAITARQPIERVRLTTETGIDYFDSDMQMLWVPGWKDGPVLDRDEMIYKDGDSDERAYLRTVWPRIEFSLVLNEELADA